MTKKIPYSDFKHGQRCTCEIDGQKVTDAKISINGDGSIYICQNIKDGFEADDMFGYNYSWKLVNPNKDFKYGEALVTNLTLPRTIEDVEEGDEIVSKDVGERKVLGRCGQIVFLGRLLSNDAYENTYSIHDLKFRGYTIKFAERNSKLVEITMEEIADKFNIPLDQLRIKE